LSNSPRVALFPRRRLPQIAPIVPILRSSSTSSEDEGATRIIQRFSDAATRSVSHHRGNCPENSRSQLVAGGRGDCGVPEPEETRACIGMETNRRSAAVPRLGQCGAPNVHPVGKSSPVAGTANVHTPAKGILAVAAVIEIALSAQPMAGQTWRRRKDWRYDIWSRCYRCWPHRGILTGHRRPRGGHRLAREPATSAWRIFCVVSAAWRTIRC
jgi:hypothetical protein